MKKHQSYDLKQMQSLPLESKIIMTQQRIRQWYDYWDGMVYVSFSGGKDSTVLKHIVENTPGVYDVPSLFVNTGLEYPEIQKFAMSQPNVTTARPEMRFDEVIKKYGYPAITKQVADCVEGAIRNPTGSRARRLRGEYGGRTDGKASKFDCPQWEFLLNSPFQISAKCCDVMKKNPLKKYEKESGRKPYIGVLACESQVRKTEWMKHGCNAFNASKPSSRPMSFWTEQDVLHYIKKFNIPYCSVYGDIRVKPHGECADGDQIDMIDYLECYEPEDTLETTGCSRTGCIFCMFGCHLEKEPNRFQRLKETHPRQYQYCIGGGEMVDGKWQPNNEGLGLGHVLDYIGVKYE